MCSGAVPFSLADPVVRELIAKKVVDQIVAIEPNALAGFLGAGKTILLNRTLKGRMGYGCLSRCQSKTGP